MASTQDVSSIDMWVYHSPVGMFEIYPVFEDLYSLWLADEPIGVFKTPEKAARAVFFKHTGDRAWDGLITHSGPADLSEWEYYN
jgi:hypothetical protein